MNKLKSLFKNRRRKLIALILIGILSFGTWQYFGPKQNTPQYQTSVVEKGTIVSSVSASGLVQTANFTPVTTNAGGTVVDVYVKDGDTVIAGQKIMDLSLDRDGQEQNASAFASYLGAQANLNSARAKINSLQATLFKTNQAFITDRGVPNPTTDQKADPVYIQENATWLQAEADYKNQQTVIAQTQSALNSAWINFEQSSATVTAPTAGTIDSVTFAPGMIITSSQTANSSGSSTNSSQRVAVIKNDNLPVASVSVTEIDVYKIKTGMPVILTLDSMVDKTFTGKVVSVDRIGAVSSNVASYPLIVQFDTGNAQILPNMAVTAKIIIDNKSDVLLVPSVAVQSSTVKILKNGMVQTVNVETGIISDTQTEITSGLSEGDTVITGTAPTTTTGSTTRSVFGGAGGFGGTGFSGGGNIRRPN